MKHYEVNFVDQTVETIASESLPPDIEHPMFLQGEDKQLVSIPVRKWWTVTLLTLDAETHSKFVSHGRIHINIDNVTFIKET